MKILGKLALGAFALISATQISGAVEKNDLVFKGNIVYETVSVLPGGISKKQKNVLKNCEIKAETINDSVAVFNEGQYSSYEESNKFFLPLLNALEIKTDFYFQTMDNVSANLSYVSGECKEDRFSTKFNFRLNSLEVTSGTVMSSETHKISYNENTTAEGTYLGDFRIYVNQEEKTRIQSNKDLSKKIIFSLEQNS